MEGLMETMNKEIDRLKRNEESINLKRKRIY
jgi:hypothetical protein